jgi:hypothetical protein
MLNKWSVIPGLLNWASRPVMPFMMVPLDIQGDVVPVLNRVQGPMLILSDSKLYLFGPIR